MLPIWIKSRSDNDDDCEWDEPKEWSMDEILFEINRDRSEEWDEDLITKANWKEGWKEVESEGFNKLAYPYEWLETNQEWIDMAKPIEKFLSCKLTACDPNFVFRMRDGSQANVPFQFIIELNNKLYNIYGRHNS